MINLEWDTNFFEFKVAKIVSKNNQIIENELIICFDKNIKLVYLFSDRLVNENILNNYNGKLVDTKIIFEKYIDPKSTSSISLDNIVEYDKKYTKEKLYKLAFISGKYSRFNIDEQIGRSKFEELYRLWVDNSIAGKLADKVFIFIEENEIFGFITINIDNGVGNIGLIAVDENQQGKKIGTKLIKKVENYLICKGITRLNVPTQEKNELAVKFYKKNNFNISNSTCIYHFWNKK